MNGHWKLRTNMNNKKIGVVGTGKFGMLLVRLLPSVFPHSQIISCTRKTVSTVNDCDLVIPAVPTESFAAVIRTISPLLKKHSIVMDVCSVKIYPLSVMKKELRDDILIIASHPMFGPGTVAKLENDWTGLRIVMERVRGEKSEYLEIREAFVRAGFDVVEMTSENHDRYAAEFHFTAHVIAALVKKIQLSRSPIDTRSVESLFDFAEMVQTDDTKLLKDMYTYNPFCKKQFQKINTAYESITSLLKQS